MKSEHESPAVSDQTFRLVDAKTDEPCPTDGPVLCTIARNDPAHRHAAAHSVEKVDPEPLTPRERAAQRLLALAALKKMLAAADARMRADAEGAFTRSGQKETVDLPDGTLLGNVRTDPGKAAGWQLTDAGAFRAWVEATGIVGGIVEQVTTVVDPGLIESTLAELAAPTPGTEWIDPGTGEVLAAPPGMTYVPAGKPRLVVTTDKGAPDAVARLLGPTLQQLGIAP